MSEIQVQPGRVDIHVVPIPDDQANGFLTQGENMKHVILKDDFVPLPFTTAAEFGLLFHGTSTSFSQEANDSAVERGSGLKVMPKMDMIVAAGGGLPLNEESFRLSNDATPNGMYSGPDTPGHTAQVDGEATYVIPGNMTGQTITDTALGYWDPRGRSCYLPFDVHVVADTSVGTKGDDNFFGNARANTFTGGNGDDHMNGARGNDTLSGGKGDDVFVFIGNFGKDVVDGNQGADTFSFEYNNMGKFAHGSVTIENFDPKVDHLVINNGEVADSKIGHGVGHLDGHDLVIKATDNLPFEAMM